MNHDLRAEVRAAFDARFVPSPGLAARALALDPDLPRGRLPGWVAWAVGSVAVVMVGLGALLLSPARDFVPGLAPSNFEPLSPGTFFSGTDGWVIRRVIDARGPGASAVFYVTHDGGASWTEKLRADGNWFEMSWSPDRRTGVIWTVTRAAPDCKPAVNGQTGPCSPPTEQLVVYQTTDAGDHWTKRPAPSWAPGGPTLGNPIFFKDGNEGWALSQGNRDLNSTVGVYHSGDGGATWERVSDLTPVIRANGTVFGTGVFNLVFADATHGWYSARQPAQAAHSGLLATSDGGRTWTEVPLPSPDAGGVMVVGIPTVFADGRAVLPVEVRAPGADNASTSRLYVFGSSDSGVTWGSPRPMTPPSRVTVGEIPVIDFLDADHWWVSSQSQAGGDRVQAAPTVTFTADGGRSFTTVAAPRIIQMRFTDRTHGWAEAVTGPRNRNQLLRTQDGGRHWSEVLVPS